MTLPVQSPTPLSTNPVQRLGLGLVDAAARLCSADTVSFFTPQRDPRTSTTSIAR